MMHMTLYLARWSPYDYHQNLALVQAGSIPDAINKLKDIYPNDDITADTFNSIHFGNDYVFLLDSSDLL
jgi:hypothetical protein